MQFLDSPWFKVVSLVLSALTTAGFFVIGIWQISTRKTVPEVLAESGWTRMSSATMQGWVFVALGVVMALMLIVLAVRPSRGSLEAFIPEPALVLSEKEGLVIMLAVMLGNSGPTPSTATDWEAWLRRKDSRALEPLDVPTDFPPELTADPLSDPRFMTAWRLNQRLIPKLTLEKIPERGAISGMLLVGSRSLTRQAVTGATLVLRFKDSNGRRYEIEKSLEIFDPNVNRVRP
jgi:hypothetical protein